MASKRVCVFCGFSDLTREHVFPDWMSKMLDSHLDGTTTIERGGKVEKSYKGALLQHKVRLVCKDCNNVWMSKLENEVKPILSKMLFDLNHSALLGEREQRILAYWAQKTVLILDVATGADYVMPGAFFRDLFEKQAPIDNITVRIGWRLPKQGRYGPQLAHFTISEVDGPERSAMSKVVGDFEVWRAIIAIGNVVFHINGSTPNVHIEVGNIDKRVTPQIFPFENNLSWPLEWPVNALTSTGQDEFSAV